MTILNYVNVRGPHLTLSKLPSFILVYFINFNAVFVICASKVYKVLQRVCVMQKVQKNGLN